jgi:hypothetical protein
LFSYAFRAKFLININRDCYQHESILIIEDEKDIVGFIEYDLKQSGLSVINALDVSISCADTADPPEALFVAMDYPASKTQVSLYREKEISGQVNDRS